MAMDNPVEMLDVPDVYSPRNSALRRNVGLTLREIPTHVQTTAELTQRAAANLRRPMGNRAILQIIAPAAARKQAMMVAAGEGGRARMSPAVAAAHAARVGAGVRRSAGLVDAPGAAKYGADEYLPPARDPASAITNSSWAGLGGLGDVGYHRTGNTQAAMAAVGMHPATAYVGGLGVAASDVEEIGFGALGLADDRPRYPETAPGNQPADPAAGKSGGFFNVAADFVANVFGKKSDVEIAQANADAEQARASRANAGVRPSIAETLTRPAVLLPILGVLAAAGVAYAVTRD